MQPPPLAKRLAYRPRGLRSMVVVRARNRGEPPGAQRGARVERDRVFRLDAELVPAHVRRGAVLERRVEVEAPVLADRGRREPAARVE